MLPIDVDGARPAVARVTALPRTYRLTAAERLILLTLACDSYEGDEAAPSYAAMAAWTGLSQGVLVKSLRALQATTDSRPALLAKATSSRGHHRTAWRLLLPEPVGIPDQFPEPVSNADEWPPEPVSIPDEFAPPEPVREPVGEPVGAPDDTLSLDPQTPIGVTSAVVVVDDSRPDIDHLLDILDAEIERNGSRRPRRGQGNLDAMRRLIDIDGRAPAEVEAVIRWCQADGFWRSNILSAITLRKQFDRLRLQMQRAPGGGGGAVARDARERQVVAAYLAAESEQGAIAW